MTGPDHTIFLHIPKTAGTTLYTVLDRQYPAGSVHTFGNAAQESVAALKAMPAEQRARLRLVRGHMDFGIHAWFPGSTAYVTILRDPVDRVVSYYNYAASLPEHYLHEAITAGAGRSLEQLLGEEIPLMMNDGAVRLLSGVWGDVGFGEVTDAHLATARHRLEHDVAAVGLTERFDASLVLWSRVLAWSEPITYERHNVSEGGVRRDDLPSSTIRAIEAANVHDRALYDTARSVFARQVRAQGPGFAVDLARLVWARHRPPVRSWLRRVRQQPQSRPPVR